MWYSLAWSITLADCMTPELTAASTPANASVSKPPVPMSCIMTVAAESTSPPALEPNSAHTEVMPAMNTARPMPETLRHARFGLSRMRRMAIIVAAFLGRRARDRARSVTANEPTRLISAKQPMTKPKMMAIMTPVPALISCMFDSTASAPTSATRKMTSRTELGRGWPWRAETPSGVIATRRNVSSAETSASNVTPATVATSAIGPTHSCANVKCWFWNVSSMISGISAK